MMTKNGEYLVCWCPDNMGGCNSRDDFRIHMGKIVVGGVDIDQSWSCVVNHSCEIMMQALTSGGLTAGNKVQV